MKSNFSRPEGKLSVYDILMKLMNVSDGSVRKVNTDGLDCKPLLKPHFYVMPRNNIEKRH